MAHSIQEFRGRFVTLNDLDIVALIAILHEIAREQPDQKLAAILTRLDLALQVAGPGTIDLKLDATLQSSEERQDFLEILEKLRTRVAQFGETIPASALNRTTRASGTQLTDYPTYLIVGLSNALEGLLR